MELTFRRDVLPNSRVATCSYRPLGYQFVKRMLCNDLSQFVETASHPYLPSFVVFQIVVAMDNTMTPLNERIELVFQVFGQRNKQGRTIVNDGQDNPWVRLD